MFARAQVCRLKAPISTARGHCPGELEENDRVLGSILPYVIQGPQNFCSWEFCAPHRALEASFEAKSFTYPPHPCSNTVSTILRKPSLPAELHMTVVGRHSQHLHLPLLFSAQRHSGGGLASGDLAQNRYLPQAASPLNQYLACTRLPQKNYG